MRSSACLSVLLVMIFAEISFGHDSYVGYSGAPGCMGTCASSCHGNPGGTITISGFPAAYTPLQQYNIEVYHTAGTTIRNLNLSIRVGTSSANAGTLSSGINSASYNTSGETNGIHLSTTSVDSASFAWTAPDAGTGTVKLYLGGLQGSKSGQNTTLVLSSTEFSSVDYDNPTNTPNQFYLSQNYPNPFNSASEISYFVSKPARVALRVFNVLGQPVRTLVDEYQTSGEKHIVWDSKDDSGHPTASGIYFYRLTVGNEVKTKKLLLLK